MVTHNFQKFPVNLPGFYFVLHYYLADNTCEINEARANRVLSWQFGKPTAGANQIAGSLSQLGLVLGMETDGHRWCAVPELPRKHC